MGWLLRISTTGSVEAEDELLTSTLWDLETTGIFQDGDGSMVAGFETKAAADQAQAQLSVGPVDGADRMITVEVAPTAASWVGDDRPVPVTITTADRQIDLQIRAGGAFGHGSHETTTLALDLLLEHLRPGDRVLDVGTGTGVLAVAAAAAGAQAVVGTDNEPLAIEVATGNIALNAPAEGWSVSCGLWTVEEGLAALGGPVDIVVINVLLVVHRELAEAVTAGLNSGGRLVTAGFLFEQEEQLVELYRPPLTEIERRRNNDWSAAVFGRQPPDSGDEA